MSEVLPSSLIILKNSIIEGRVPTSSNLEVGELALGLFKGKESIWAKNSSGEVIDLRSPRHDLMWGDLFKKYETKEEFNIDLDSGNILNTSVVFIKETSQIWSDGVFYGTDSSWEDIEGYILSQVVIFPIEVTNLINNYNPDRESTYSHEVINRVFKGKVNFIRLIRNLNKKPYVSSLKLEHGVLPITATAKETSGTEYVLNLEYYLGGEYIQVEIKLESDIFSITKKSLDFINISSDISDLEERITVLENTGVGTAAESILWTNVIE